MCGLTFIYSHVLPVARLEEITGKALSLLVHRGPDDSGIETGNYWVAGHLRLSIIDLAPGPPNHRTTR